MASSNASIHKPAPEGQPITRRQVLSALPALACVPALRVIGNSEVSVAKNAENDEATFLTEVYIPCLLRLLGEAQQRLAELTGGAV